MTKKDIFSEFISLDWKEHPRNLNLPEKDLILGEYIVARINNSGCVVHYLTTGNTITIPKIWLDVFSVLNVHSGARIIHLGETGDEVEQIIYYMLLIVLYLDINRGSEALEILGKLGETKTQKFREWTKTMFDLDFPPLILLTPDSRIEI